MANGYTFTEQQENIDLYLKGCVNLYGFVTPRQFLKIYNRYNSPKIKKADLLFWRKKFDYHSYDSYTLYGNAITNARVPEEKINEIIYYQEGKKYYDPSKQEILLYSDYNYYEKNIFTEKLHSFLTETIKINPLIAYGFTAKICWMIRTEEPISAQYKLMESCGIIPEDMKAFNILISLIQDLNNNTRKWANCGYTPKELFESSLNADT